MSIASPSYAGTHTNGDGGCGCGGTDPCAPEGALGLERTRWFRRMLVGPDELIQEQRYELAARRRHNRIMHGWGVACGLRVTTGKDPCTLVVEAGYALGPWGHDIVVPEDVTLDACAEDAHGNAVDACGEVDPWCTPVRVARDPDHPLFLAIRYAECETRPMRVFGAGCGCDEAECEYSRTRDSYVLKLLTDLPDSHRDMHPPAVVEVRSRDSCPPECPPCPPDPWVVLAEITVKGDEIADIDCGSSRRHVLTLGRFFYVCRSEREKYPGRIEERRVAVMADTSPEPTAVERAEPIMISARRADRSWTLIPLDTPVGPDDLLEDILSDHPREFTDPETGETFDLSEIAATAGLRPSDEIGSLEELAARLEHVELGRVRDRRVAEAALSNLLDSSGRRQLSEEGDVPDRVVGLPATSLQGIGAESDAGKRLAETSIGELAAMDEQELTAKVTKRLAAAKRDQAISSAREARLAAIRTLRIAEAWREHTGGREPG